MRLRLAYATLLLAFALLVPAARAQQPGFASFTGTVTDAETGTPLAGAHVFVASSLNGTITDAQGRYVLERVPTGALRLYVSMLGFEPQAQNLMLREARVHTVDFALAPAVLEIGELTVVGEADPRWRERLERFTRLFIGETPNAKATTIVNPEVLDFTVKGEFQAFAEAPLVIENQALGYRITYFLKDFGATRTRTRYDGEPLYEELMAESDEQAELWAENRKTAFMGSFRHFMLAALEDRTEEQGFHVFHRPNDGGPAGAGASTFGGNNALQGKQRHPVEIAELMQPAEEPNEYRLDWPGFVEIVYAGEEEDPSFLEWQGRRGRPKYQTSQLQLERGPTLVDYKGDILDPYGVTFYGYLAFERVADELPKEYRPW